MIKISDAPAQVPTDQTSVPAEHAGADVKVNLGPASDEAPGLMSAEHAAQLQTLWQAHLITGAGLQVESVPGGVVITDGEQDT